MLSKDVSFTVTLWWWVIFFTFLKLTNSPGSEIEPLKEKFLATEAATSKNGFTVLYLYNNLSIFC